MTVDREQVRRDEAIRRIRAYLTTQGLARKPIRDDAPPWLRQAMRRDYEVLDAFDALCAELKGLDSAVKAAASDLEQAERERDEARETNARLNRRCQEAEAVADANVEACRRAGVSFGRGLANYAASRAEAQLAKVPALVEAIYRCSWDWPDEDRRIMREALAAFEQAQEQR